MSYAFPLGAAHEDVVLAVGHAGGAVARLGAEAGAVEGHAHQGAAVAAVGIRGERVGHGRIYSSVGGAAIALSGGPPHGPFACPGGLAPDKVRRSASVPLPGPAGPRPTGVQAA